LNKNTLEIIKVNFVSYFFTTHKYRKKFERTKYESYQNKKLRKKKTIEVLKKIQGYCRDTNNLQDICEFIEIEMPMFKGEKKVQHYNEIKLTTEQMLESYKIDRLSPSPKKLDSRESNIASHERGREKSPNPQSQ
jgi:hypothetical protein